MITRSHAIWITIVALLGCAGNREMPRSVQATTAAGQLSLGEVWIAPITSVVAADSGKVDTPPQLLFAVTPKYPSLALSAGIEGAVVIEALVGDEGAILEWRTMAENATLSMELAVEEQLPTFTFRPAQRDGATIPCHVSLRVYFSLR